MADIQMKIETTAMTRSTVEVDVRLPAYRKRVMSGLPASGGYVMVYYKILGEHDCVTVTTNVNAGRVFDPAQAHNFTVSFADGHDVPFYGQTPEFIRGEGEHACTAEEFDAVVSTLCARAVRCLEQ